MAVGKRELEGGGGEKEVHERTHLAWQWGHLSPTWFGFDP